LQVWMRDPLPMKSGDRGSEGGDAGGGS